jgi:hypothetical protein
MKLINTHKILWLPSIIDNYNMWNGKGYIDVPKPTAATNMVWLLSIVILLIYANGNIKES